MLVQGILAVVKLDSKPKKIIAFFLTFPSFREGDLVSLTNSIADEAVGSCASTIVRIES